MKKFLATVIALSAITAAVTGCSGNTSSSSSSNSSNSSNSSSDTSSSVASDNSSAGTSQAESGSESQTTERTAEDLAQAVFKAIDWVSSEQITDAEIAKTMVNLDLDLLDDYSIYLPTMSVHLDEIVIVKPKAGKEAEVQVSLTSTSRISRTALHSIPTRRLQQRAQSRVRPTTDSTISL